MTNSGNDSVLRDYLEDGATLRDMVLQQLENVLSNEWIAYLRVSGNVFQELVDHLDA